ncbi:MAG: His/Gly/Thr/Pro-type tRNA ligase C-terminal domain-containing protein, partial [Ardenticatenaceae bacterium]
VSTVAESVYEELQEAGLRVLYDDRGERAGVKFNDADLIGLPLRLVVSERLLRTDEVELKPRLGGTTLVARDQLLTTVKSVLSAISAQLAERNNA